MTRDEFIRVVAPIAVKLRLEGSPIFPSVRIAQAILETGNQLNAWNNLVGLKVGSGQPNRYWDGSYVNRLTWEVVNNRRVDNVSANFRAYASIEDGFRDQDLFFAANPRYAGVISAATADQQFRALGTSGYATDPAYESKLRSIAAGSLLYGYDQEVERVLQELRGEIASLRQSNEALMEQVRGLVEARVPAEVPDWARAAVDAAVAKGVIDTPEGGSYDFYRMVTIMHRLGLF